MSKIDDFIIDNVRGIVDYGKEGVPAECMDAADYAIKAGNSAKTAKTACDTATSASTTQTDACKTATDEAENVNAELNGTVIEITDRDGETKKTQTCPATLVSSHDTISVLIDKDNKVLGLSTSFIDINAYRGSQIDISSCESVGAYKYSNIVLQAQGRSERTAHLSGLNIAVGDTFSYPNTTIVRVVVSDGISSTVTVQKIIEIIPVRQGEHAYDVVKDRELFVIPVDENNKVVSTPTGDNAKIDVVIRKGNDVINVSSCSITNGLSDKISVAKTHIDSYPTAGYDIARFTILLSKDDTLSSSLVAKCKIVDSNNETHLFDILIVPVKNGANGTNGTNGQDGADAYTIHCTCEKFVVPVEPNGVCQSTYSQKVLVYVYKGSEQVQITSCYVSNPSETGKQYSFVADNQGTYAKCTFTVNAGCTLGDEPVLHGNIVADGITFYLEFYIVPVKKGDKGEQGNILFPEMSYDATSGELIIKSDGFTEDELKDRFQYDATTGVLTIKISNI